MTAIPLPPRTVALRPLALPAEHGGWGILFEPILIGLLVAPSWSGALVAAAAIFGFLARHPLKLALQDLLRNRAYPRTMYCRLFAGSYLLGGLLALSGAIAIGGTRILVPLALAAPFALVQVTFDARNRSRELIAEISGAIAMSSVPAAIALADGQSALVACGLSGIALARLIPTILYVRTLLGRFPAWAALAAHAAALLAIATYAPSLAILAMTLLLARALWGVTHKSPPAKVIGWREIAYGVITVGLVAVPV